MDLGIFVITSLLSIVTENVAPLAKGAELNEVGIVKFFGSQSSIKKPIVAASDGSTCGLTVVVSVGGGFGCAAFLLQEQNRISEK